MFGYKFVETAKKNYVGVEWKEKSLQLICESELKRCVLDEKLDN